jgi:hypothetical protein
MLKRWVVNFLATAVLAGGGVSDFSVANGQESYLDVIDMVREPLTLERGATTTLPLNMLRHVNYLEIDAYGVGGEGMFEVIVNGQVKGTIHVPGQDPKYVVTIADQTRNLVLRHISGQKARVTALKVYFTASDNHSHLPPSQQDAAMLSRDIINKMSQFQALISVDDFQAHVLPIKIAAGHSYAIATASGDLSKRLAEALGILQVQFRESKSFFDACMSQDRLFDLSVQALELKYRLDEMVD